MPGSPVPFRTFYRAVAPVVAAVHALEPRMFTATLAVQFANETGRRPTGIPCCENNWAGITSGGRLVPFPSVAAFAQAYKNAIDQDAYGYPAVLAASTPVQQMYALGRSGWAGGHYAAGGVPGAALVELYAQTRPLIANVFGPQSAPPTASPSPGTVTLGGAAVPRWLPLVVLGVPVAAVLIDLIG